MSDINILVCDDDREIAGAIEIYLRNEGYNVFKAFDGVQALDIARRQELHLIIMDVMMPNVDGLTATRMIRGSERPDAKEIPILAMTANAFSDDIQQSIEAGMDAHISKPVDMKVLEATVRSFCVTPPKKIRSKRTFVRRAETKSCSAPRFRS